MTERLDERWGRYDSNFPSNERFLAIPMHNAQELRGKAYLLLLSMAGWSHTNRTDGLVPDAVVSDLCQRLWPATPIGVVLGALLDRKVHLVRRVSRGLQLLKFAKWEQTTKESAVFRESGRVGASKRWGKDGPGYSPPHVAEAEAEAEAEQLHLETEDALSTRVDFVGQVFETWRGTAGKNGRTLLDDKRRAVIAKALKLYPLEDVLDAVRGWQQIPHNRGENDRRRPFNDIELLLRDAKHIETFRDAQRGLVATRGKEHPLDTWAHDVLEGGSSGPQELR